MTNSDESLISRLLYAGEGPALDYKSEQYKFANAQQHEKAELLKDVLAFANSHRHGAAYILLGVQEVTGQLPVVLGLANSDHMDDADLQQFVNEKMNRPIRFSYRVAHYQGKAVGIIEIPQQKRPFFLKGDFLPLRARLVYVRRGSSTAIADPDEIAAMGAVVTEPADLEVRLVHPSLGSPIAEPIQVVSTYIEGVSFEEAAAMDRRGPDPIQVGLFPWNRSYYTDLMNWSHNRYLHQPLRVSVENRSSIIAKDIQLYISSVDPDLSHLDLHGMGQRPSQDSSEQRHTLPQDLHCRTIDAIETVIVSIPLIRPKEVWLSQSSFFVGSDEPGVYQLEARIHGDFPDPISRRIETNLEVLRKVVSWHTLED